VRSPTTPQYKGALADANSAIALDSNQSGAYYFRSRVYPSLGNQTAASADAQTASNLDKAIDDTDFKLP
jgi:hypothetical protein